MPGVSLMSRAGLRQASVLLARLIVAGIFLFAALPKLIDVETFARSIANYRVLPEAWAGSLASILPWIEAFAALALLTGWYLRGGALVVSAMLLVFIAAIAQAMARGIDIDCGCFGAAAESEVGWGSIARNLGLLLLCLWLLLPMNRESWRLLGGRTKVKPDGSSSEGKAR